MYDANGNEVSDSKQAKYVQTNYLADKLINAFDGETLDFEDVKISFKVLPQSEKGKVITNYAQISEERDENNQIVPDRDSTPNVWIENDDDQDTEKVKVKYFDLALKKWVSKAIVTENGVQRVTETGHTATTNPEPVVKVDLKKSNINDCVVKFEYQIQVVNEGEIAGYAKEIEEHIPAGLRFVASDNANWKEVDGRVVTTALENTLLQPGEAASVSIVLTWINDSNNFGVLTNVAEISKDYNENNAKDIDSTPGNNVPNEDDIDDAPVMLTVKTGSSVVAYITLVFAFVSIVFVGAFVVKKRVA